MRFLCATLHYIVHKICLTCQQEFLRTRRSMLPQNGVNPSLLKLKAPTYPSCWTKMLAADAGPCAPERITVCNLLSSPAPSDMEEAESKSNNLIVSNRGHAWERDEKLPSLEIRLQALLQHLSHTSHIQPYSKMLGPERFACAWLCLNLHFQRDCIQRLHGSTLLITPLIHESANHLTLWLTLPRHFRELAECMIGNSEQIARFCWY